MTRPRIFALAGAAMLLLATGGEAQYFYNLPNADFRWNWGEIREDRRFGHADITMNGAEAGFDCEFTVRFRPTSNMSPADIRAFRDSLATRLDFIYAVSENMYYMDQDRSIDWATLDCKKFEPEPRTPEESAQKQNEAREKMLRELERRRARQRDDH